MPYRIATMLPSEPADSYVRDALRRGLAFESRGIANPYGFGFTAPGPRPYRCYRV